MATILCVDDDPAISLLLEASLERAGHKAVSVRTVAEATGVLARGDIDLVVANHQLRGASGLELLATLRRDRDGIPLILLTSNASVEEAMASIRAGAMDCVTKPVRPEALELAVNRALEQVRLRRENATLRRETAEFRSVRLIVGQGAPMHHILQTVAMAARISATVLLQGEPGTGKALLARAIHDQSDRRDHPFIRLDCAALPGGLIESALFGSERGAVADAVVLEEGAFERAHRGTLLLEDISTLRLPLQDQLLRALQEREFTRVGGATRVRADVRVISAASVDLAAAAAEGAFRPELYHRLSVVPIIVPPLRDRRHDIPALALQFAIRAARETGKQVTGLSQEAIAYLQACPWPGNVRELEDAVARAVIVTRDTILGVQAFSGDDHPPAVRAIEPSAEVRLSSLNIDEAERALIQRALAATDGNRTKAAALLGISVRTLRNKLNASDN